MFIQINKNVFVLASDVISVKRVTKQASENYGKWVAVVKHEYEEVQYLIPDGEERIVVSEINNALKN